jgi:hypothetical protein
MAKKKQLAGKETKLAKHRLTRVLAGRGEEATAPWGPPVPPPPPETGARQLPLTWEQVGEGAAGPLAAAYLAVLQELAALQAEFPPAPGGTALNSPPPLPASLPSRHHLEQALRQTQKDLQDLDRLLSGE